MPGEPAEPSAAPLSSTIDVEVAYSPGPRQVDLVSLAVPVGTTLEQAVARSGLLERHGLDAGTVKAGIWSRVQPPGAPLRDRDRIELYRGLVVDPKEARRLRYKGSARKARRVPPER